MLHAVAALALLVATAPSATSSTHTAADVLAAALATPLAPGEAAPSVDGVCGQHSTLYRDALQQLQPWALRMYDASAKLSGGVLTGAVSQLGQLDECVAVRVASTSPAFSGRHCTTQLRASVLPLAAAPAPDRGSLRELILAVAAAVDLEVESLASTVTYRWSFCVPSSCSAGDVRAELQAKLAPLAADPTANLSVAVPDSACFTADTARPLSPELVAFLCLVALLAAVVIIGTALDVFTTKEMPPPRWRRGLCAFSLRASWRSLFGGGGGGSAGGGGGRIECFDGVRVLSILWIVLGHTYYMTAVQPLRNAIQVTDWHEQWYRMPVMNGTVSTDSFFVLGAALLAMGFLRERERRQERGRRLGAELCRAVALRYVRLTPPYALLVFIYAAALPRLGAGPLWDSVVGPEADNCRRYWWTNMLYVNNYVHLDHQCMNQTWYLAVDMQLFVVALLLLTAMWVWPRATPLCLLAALVAAVATPLAIAAAYGLSGSMLYTMDDAMLVQVFTLLYTPSHCRAAAYVVGLGLGYTLHRLRGKQLPLAMWQETALWVASGLVWALCVPSALALYAWWPAAPQPWSALYAGLQRPLWSLALAWLLLACAKGRAPPLHWLLSLPVFRPLSALVYCVYLTHYAILIYIDGNVRTAGFLSDFSTVQSAIGVLVTSLGVSLVLHLAVELPTVALSKEFLRPRAPAGTQQTRPTPVAKAEPDSRAEPLAVDMGCYDNGGLDLSLDKQGSPSPSSSTAVDPRP